MTLTVRLFNNPNKLYGHKRNHSGKSYILRPIGNWGLTLCESSIILRVKHYIYGHFVNYFWRYNYFWRNNYFWRKHSTGTIFRSSFSFCSTSSGDTTTPQPRTNDLVDMISSVQSTGSSGKFSVSLCVPIAPFSTKLNILCTLFLRMKWLLKSFNRA